MGLDEDHAGSDDDVRGAEKFCGQRFTFSQRMIHTTIPAKIATRGHKKRSRVVQPVEHGLPALGSACTMIEVAHRDIGRDLPSQSAYERTRAPPRRGKTDGSDEFPSVFLSPQD
jgi:hypothetical protein